MGAGCRLQTDAPGTSYAVLEARDAIGGTWDLFRYPGIRSDSDLYTFGYPFRPWTGSRQFAGGEEMRRYITDTAAAYGVDRRIRFRTRVVAADWSSAEGRWTVTARGPDGEELTLTCTLLYACTGYYDYTSAHAPDWPGAADFAGRLVHPQFWPEDLDCRGRRVVVIGSGATAVTLVPALVRRGAAEVTLLQRSPSYVTALPSVDPVATRLGRLLPGRAGYRLQRARSVLLAQAFYTLSRRRPTWARSLLHRQAVARVGAATVQAHFTPDYDPWDQRLCVAPDGDLFDVLASGAASVVTDRIDRFTPAGLRLVSGRELAADVVVSATGLRLLPLGGTELRVDGRPVDLGRRTAYRGVMLSGVPNFAFCVGYSNASWTLRADLSSRFVCRFLRYLRRHDLAYGVPHSPDGPGHPLLPLRSGYVLRALDRFPRRGDRAPWTLPQNYLRDAASTRLARLDTAMTFVSRAALRDPARRSAPVGAAR